LLGVAQFVKDEENAEFLAFVSGIATCFIIAAISATVFMMDEEHGIRLTAILRMLEFIPFLGGLLLMGAMFLKAAMQIPGYAYIVWVVLAYSMVAGPIYGYTTYRRLKEEEQKTVGKMLT
jgi:hypothetical protein